MLLNKNLSMKKDIIKCALSALLMAGGFVSEIFFPYIPYLSMALFVISYLIVGIEVLIDAFSGIFRGNFMNETFLMTIATVGALVIGEYAEAVGVMLFYNIGEMFQEYSVNKSRKSISALMEICPEKANLIMEGEIKEIPAEEVKEGDILLVKPGERFPVDSVITSGETSIDRSALTGESLPRSVKAGDEILSGEINLNGTVHVKALKEAKESAAAKILEMTENASERKSKSEKFITRFSAVYTPLVVILAVLLAVIPPLLIEGQDFSTWIYRALSFLVVSCPCALVISVPLSFFAAIGRSSREGILVKGGTAIESLSKVSRVVFDKTGTLTKGKFEVSRIKPAAGISEAELLHKAALLECNSSHPIALSVMKAYGEAIENMENLNHKEIAGKGVMLEYENKVMLAGNLKLLKDYDVAGTENVSEAEAEGTVVYIAEDGKYLGLIEVSDTLKQDSTEAVNSLKKENILSYMLTGDSKISAQKMAEKLGISEVKSELLPGDKLSALESIMKDNKEAMKTAFVGDGINDAPSIALSDVGIAMGALGSDAAVEASDVVLVDDKPSKILTAIKLARKTMVIVKENIVFALGVKFLVLLLIALGLGNMWFAIFADVGVSVLAILNSMRMLIAKSK